MDSIYRLSEPYFNDQLLSITGQDRWSKQDEILWNQVKRQSDKHTFYQYAYEFISDNHVDGDYHEFGCHRARTFRMALLEASRHFLDNTKFYAYDSFKGLPEASTQHGLQSRWKPGMLSTSPEQFRKLLVGSGFSLDNVVLFEGFYSESLKTITPVELNYRKASLIAIDCDLYESAVPVFNYIDKILQEGTILYIDDFFTGYKGNPRKGVSRALSGWQEKSDWELIEYRDVGWAGKSFVVYQ